MTDKRRSLGKRAKSILSKIIYLYEKNGKPPDSFLISRESGVATGLMYFHTKKLENAGYIKRIPGSGGFIFFYNEESDEDCDKRTGSSRKLILHILKNNKPPREDGGWTVSLLWDLTPGMDRTNISSIVRELQKDGLITVIKAEPDSWEPLI